MSNIEYSKRVAAELYEAKVARARTASRGLPGELQFSEITDPRTGGRYRDDSNVARNKRVSTWLKKNDRRYWDEHFSVQPETLPPAQRVTRPLVAVTQDHPAPKVQTIVAIPNQVPSHLREGPVTYWTKYPTGATPHDTFSGANAAATMADLSALAISDSFKTRRWRVDVHVANASSELVGRIALVPKPTGTNYPTDLSLGVMVGTPHGCLELRSGINHYIINFSNPVTASVFRQTQDLFINRLEVTDNPKYFVTLWVSVERDRLTPPGHLKTPMVVNISNND